jgi:hypothetical protein
MTGGCNFINRSFSLIKNDRPRLGKIIMTGGNPDDYTRHGMRVSIPPFCSNKFGHLAVIAIHIFVLLNRQHLGLLLIPRIGYSFQTKVYVVLYSLSKYSILFFTKVLSIYLSFTLNVLTFERFKGLT